MMLLLPLPVAPEQRDGLAWLCAKTDLFQHRLSPPPK